MSQYYLDANIFVEAKRFTYPFDIFPGYWEWLDQQFEEGVISSIKPIYDELKDGNDILAQWAKDRKDSGWFGPVDDADTQSRFAEIATWAMGQTQKFKQAAIDEFLSVGDSWLIAKAYSTGATIVTHEKFDMNCRRKILIPVVCREFNIPYIKNLELFRAVGAQFRI